MFRYIKKADIFLFVALVFMGLFLSWLSLTDSDSGKNAVITVDGKLYGTYSVSKDQTIEISQNGHTNKITIKDGAVQMSYSDCHNQVCVDDGKITRTNQSIVCLPNRVMVEITGGEEGLDAVAS
ncbi:MAG: NusG domain II-containing protein [Emergencia sp.]|nr:NusG domain II-containing protein [Emergencia sp.]